MDQMDGKPTGQWKVTSFMNPWIASLEDRETDLMPRFSRNDRPLLVLRGAPAARRQLRLPRRQRAPLKKISKMCTPGVDRIWKFHENPKHTHWNGNIFENSICYLLQDDYICIYIVYIHVFENAVCRYIHITHSSLQCISVYLCAWGYIMRRIA